jgi:hypothetical protein
VYNDIVMRKFKKIWQAEEHPLHELFVQSVIERSGRM